MTYKCDKCQRQITNGVYRYSLQNYREALCIQCQDNKRIEEGTPKKLVEFMREHNKRYAFNNLNKNT